MAKSSKQSVGDRVRKELPDFASEISSLDSAQLEHRLAELAKAAEEVRDTKDADESLENARALVSELSAPYSDSLKVIRLKSRYIIAVINGKE